MGLIAKAKALVAKVRGEHEFKATITEDVFYPDHEQRTESPTFRRTKHDMDAHGMQVCAVCGSTEEVQWHHRFIEWAFADAVDFDWIKGVATGKITQMWSEEAGKMVDIPKLHVVYDMLALTHDFDWKGFDPSKPEAFVDSGANMWPLCQKHHLGKDHGIHVMSFPIWVVQSCLKRGFVFSPDEMRAKHGSS